MRVFDDEVRSRLANVGEQRPMQGPAVDQPFGNPDSLLEQGCGEAVEQTQKLGVGGMRGANKDIVILGRFDVTNQQFDGGAEG